MVLTNKQEEGLKLAVSRYQQGEKYTCIAGYAGTGKSTLIKFIIAALDVCEDDVRYVAYTGKAANVLKQKGCPGATTAHKLLYWAKLMPNGKYLYKPRLALEGSPKVVVVDEVSMLPKDIWDLLCTHKVYIIACGDPGQLPPIKKEENNHILDNPHVFLDEVMRQAAESEIIRLSMHVREGNSVLTFPCSEQEVKIFKSDEVVTGMYLWADQILCATNPHKAQINAQFRELLGFNEGPQVGDKVINLHNSWNTLSNKDNPLTNGVIGEISSISEGNLYVPSYIVKEGKVGTYSINIKIDDEECYEYLLADKQCMATGVARINGESRYDLIKKAMIEPPLEITYGYAITVWKAQGSEWNKILLYEDAGWPRGKEDRIKYMYTGITRASEKLVIIV